MQGSARSLLLVKPERLCAHAFGIEVGECIQTRVKALDLTDVRFSQLRNAKFT
jgi:hypothetical protein